MDYFPINGKSFPMNQPLRVKKDDVLRLRLYAPTMPVTFHLHGHDALVTHKDGLPLANPLGGDADLRPIFRQGGEQQVRSGPGREGDPHACLLLPAIRCDDPACPCAALVDRQARPALGSIRSRR